MRRIGHRRPHQPSLPVHRQLPSRAGRRLPRRIHHRHSRQYRSLVLRTSVRRLPAIAPGIRRWRSWIRGCELCGFGDLEDLVAATRRSPQQHGPVRSRLDAVHSGGSARQVAQYSVRGDHCGRRAPPSHKLPRTSTAKASTVNDELAASRLSDSRQERSPVSCWACRRAGQSQPGLAGPPGRCAVRPARDAHCLVRPVRVHQVLLEVHTGRSWLAGICQVVVDPQTTIERSALRCVRAGPCPVASMSRRASRSTCRRGSCG